MERGASLIAQLVKNPPAMQETPIWFLGGEVPWRRGRLPTPVFLGFRCGSVGKESSCNGGDLDSIPGLGRSPGEGKGYSLQYSGLAWTIPSMRSQRVRHNWATFIALSVFNTYQFPSVLNTCFNITFLQDRCNNNEWPEGGFIFPLLFDRYFNWM